MAVSCFVCLLAFTNRYIPKRTRVIFFFFLGSLDARLSAVVCRWHYDVEVTLLVLGTYCLCIYSANWPLSLSPDTGRILAMQKIVKGVAQQISAVPSTAHH